MPGLVVDQIWTGTLTPLTATVGGTEHQITLTAAQFQAPLDIVCATIDAALNAAMVAVWTFEVRGSNTDAPRMFVFCDEPWEIEFNGGFAGFLGYDSSTISEDPYTAVIGDSVPGCREVSVRAGYGLPSLVVEREVVHNRTPVVWSSHHEFSVELIETVADKLSIDICRQPFAIFPMSQSESTYDGEEWSLSNRGGWLALRPIDTTASRQRLGTKGGRHTKETIRCAWIGGSI